MRNTALLSCLAILTLAGCSKIFGGDKAGGAASAAPVTTPQPAATPVETVAAAATVAPTKAAPAKKKIPKCAADQILFGSDSSDTPRCAKMCSTDKDCAGGTCEFGFSFNPDTGVMYPPPGGRSQACKPPKAAYAVGDHVQIQWKGQWWPGTIIGVPGKDLYRVHYDNYGNDWDQNVGPAALKK